MHRPRPTLESVALHAGVSRATVSRVVNGSTRVAEDSRAAVLRAIEELGYVPNQAARSLVTQRTDSFALVLPEEPGRVFSDDQFFPGVVRGVGQELEDADKQLVLMMARSPASRDRIERFALARHVDGVMVASVHGADPLPAALARMGIPVVCNERLLGPTALPYVGVDNAGGAALAVRHLLGSGRTRVVTVAGPQDMVAGIDRLTGYRTALKEAGREAVVAAGDFTQESGAVAMRELLGREPELDAVFVASDLMGLGVLRALRQAGRRVPEDVAVVGFDDVQAARYADPPLTTVRQPIAEIGRRLARQLLRLAGGEAIEPAVVLDVELVLRGSA
ncbi:LacI family DNA-binding transcriptional regulator [Streptomyces sp. Rer75]|uniref:LacI family DNA-binding transcriptional regulator n=1 Tax=unclassified Streptomyces TaxID=2593676 RepID=UPI0015CF9570|nr:LacI family DNA-binding transcriptional regulator [Streptomyces sp. Rer75]QLH19786.1 LacI family DNA-binding transcriptional regulator [Streptomyces sp. Rer75]